MKIARYAAAGRESLGLIVNEGVIDLARRIPDLPADMTVLMQRFDSLRSTLQRHSTANPDFALSEVKLLSPISRPGKIMGIGLNYADHAAEAAMELPKEQLWFAKAVTAISGPFDGLELPIVSDKLDYEAELVIVIGRRCRHVSREQAPSVIFGYCVGNDASVRDWQFKTSQFILGKSFDTHAPIGPWVVTADELDPSALEVTAWVNEERRQHSNTRHLIFDCAAMIEHLSKVMTLEPGDLLFTGTPSGVGAAMKPPQYLRAGDRVRIQIEGIGAIENRVVPERNSVDNA